MKPWNWVRAILITAFLTGFAVLYSCVVYADNPYKNDYIASAKAMEWKYSLPRGFVVAICEQESRWNPEAVSNKGALGICQIMPSTFHALIVGFQTINGLKPDGVIGPITWEAFRPGAEYVYQSHRTRLLDPHQNIEWAAIYLSWIQKHVSADPLIMAGVYYGGQSNQIVKYQREVLDRWDR